MKMSRSSERASRIQQPSSVPRMFNVCASWAEDMSVSVHIIFVYEYDC